MNNRTYGYARVSDKDMNEARQVKELLAFGVDERNIKIDKVSGKNFNRREYLALVGTESTAPSLRERDLLVIPSIDRLGRNYSEIMEQWKHITHNMKVDIYVLDMPLLDTRQTQTTLDNRFVAGLVLQILSYVAQKERENIKSRQRQGIDAMPLVDGRRISSKTGQPTGRPKAIYPDNWKHVYSQWEANEITAVRAMDLLGLKKNTFYKLVMEYQG